MIRVRVREGIDPLFLWYMLLAPRARDYLRARATGSAGNMPKVNQKTIAGVPIPVPSEACRTAIVARLDAGFALADTIGRRLESASRFASRMPGSLAARVFQGGLGSIQVVQPPTC
jgi:type I restriction enzyme S subunit